MPIIKPSQNKTYKDPKYFPMPMQIFTNSSVIFQTAAPTLCCSHLSGLAYSSSCISGGKSVPAKCEPPTPNKPSQDPTCFGLDSSLASVYPQSTSSVLQDCLLNHSTLLFGPSMHNLYFLVSYFRVRVLGQGPSFY